MTRPLAVLEPGIPPIVTRTQERTDPPPNTWLNIDGAVWILGTPVAGEKGSQLWAVHLDRRDPTLQCRATPRGLGLHDIVSADPLTLSPSLLCDVCGWHGFVRDSHWVPA